MKKDQYSDIAERDRKRHADATTKLKKGQWWVDAGFSVIPVGHNKRPLISEERGGWKPYQDRVPTAEEIAAWCKEWPGLQWGIVTGPVSNLTVVDTDSPEAKEVVRLLIPADATPVIIQTPSDGHAQFWFQCDLDIPQTQVNPKLRPDPKDRIDVRNLGGYTLAPGSNAYKKDARGDVTAELGAYRLVYPDGARASDFLLQRSKIPTPLKNHLLAGRAPGAKAPPEFPQAKDGERVAVGMRDDFLFNRALALVDADMPRDIIEQAIARLLADYCEHNSDDPDPAAKVASALKYRTNNPRRGTGAESAKETVDISKALLTGTQIQALNINIDWVVDKLIPEKALTLLHGPGGLGKTWLGFAIAKAVTEGTPFLDLPTKKGEVVYIDFENPLSVFRDKTCKYNLRDSFRGWHISFNPRPPKLDSKDWERYKELPGGSLLIYDTSRSCHSGKGNDDDAAALVMERLREIRELNHHILLLHHTPRANERQAKGSTSWEDLADQVLAFYPLSRKTRKNLAEGDEFDETAPLFLGTGVKSRFERVRRHVLLNPITGEFSLVRDPWKSVKEIIANHIASNGFGQNQTQIRNWAEKEDIGAPTRPASFRKILIEGEREGRWSAEGEGREKRYYAPER